MFTANNHPEATSNVCAFAAAAAAAAAAKNASNADLR